MSKYGFSKEQIKQLLITKGKYGTGRVTVPETEWGYDYPTIDGRIEETEPDILREALIEYIYD